MPEDAAVNLNELMKLQATTWRSPPTVDTPEARDVLRQLPRPLSAQVLIELERERFNEFVEPFTPKELIELLQELPPTQRRIWPRSCRRKAPSVLADLPAESPRRSKPCSLSGGYRRRHHERPFHLAAFGPYVHKSGDVACPRGAAAEDVSIFM